MGLVVKSSGGSFTLIPEGTHIARCVQMIDLGHQTSEYEGKERIAEKLLIGWEAPNEAADGQVPIIWKRYTASLNERANLRRDLEAWRGKKFTNDELDGFDMRKIVGVPCQISVTHNTKGDRTYANVDAVVSLPKGMTAPAQVNKSIIFDINDPDMAVFATFNEHLQQTIRESQEWAAREARGGRAPAAYVDGGLGEEFADDGSDLPF